MTLSPEERKRRASIIRIDSKGEFWTLIKSELETISAMKKKEALVYMSKNEMAKASECSNVARGLDLAISCPDEILKTHDSIFNKFTHEICHSCGSMIAKIKRMVSNG
jgi:hypothetical protein